MKKLRSTCFGLVVLAVVSCDFVADKGNHTIRRVTSGGEVSTLAGSAGQRGSANGKGTDASFDSPCAVAYSNQAVVVYVADRYNHMIRLITPLGYTGTLAGAPGYYGSADGIGTAARFNSPDGVAVDRAGMVYVADRNNNNIRKITPSRAVSTLAGTAGVSGSADGPGTAASFWDPSGVVVDSLGNAYVADWGNNAIRRVSAVGVVTTLAVREQTTGDVARFDSPSGIALDSIGNLYVADGDHTIRKVSAEGLAVTLAGTSGLYGSADGIGAAASFHYPEGVAVDKDGNVFVADSNNSIIRRIIRTGMVTTLAGTAGMTGSADGMGATARFHYPTGVAVDRAGNIYVADGRNSVIRKITQDGTTTTIAGTVGASGILLGATPRLANPRGLAVIGDDIVISDSHAVLVLRHGAR